MKPIRYGCATCRLAGLKMWRMSASSHIELLCGACAANRANLDAEIGEDGKHDSEYGRTDQIGSFVPAVPDMSPDENWWLPKEASFWGYTSVPDEAVLWWRTLGTKDPSGDPTGGESYRQYKAAEAAKFDQFTETMITATRFVVKATSNEKLELWSRWARQAPLTRAFRLVEPHRVDWQEVSQGLMQVIGTIKKRPVCVSVHWASINGQTVAFVDGTSQLVDWEMIDRWLEKTFRGVPMTNATNFHNCVGRLEQSKMQTRTGG